MSSTTLLFCVVLTALEMLAAVFAKQNGWPWLVAGASTFVLLFLVYKLSLDSASLVVVTIGWIFTSQIAAVLVDKYMLGSQVTTYQYVGMFVILIGVAVMCIPGGEDVRDGDARESIETRDLHWECGVDHLCSNNSHSTAKENAR